MAGGIFTDYNKVRPGAYINTKSTPSVTSESQRGTVLLMNGQVFNWGVNGAVEIESGTDTFKTLGIMFDDDKLKEVRQALQGASRVVFVNANDGDKAKASDASVPYNMVATYAGSRGNDITVDFIQDPVNNSNVIVKTLLSSVIVDTQTVPASKPEMIADNDFVSFSIDQSKANALSTMSGEHAINLQGGTTKALDKAGMVNALSDAMQKTQYDVVTTAGIDASDSIHGLMVSMVKDLRDAQGYKVTAVVPYNGTSYDHEAVTQVANGVIDSAGNIITSSTISAWVAGQSAGIPLNQSLTYATYDGAKQSYPALTQDQIIKALNGGQLVFTDRRNGEVVVEQDINSLTTYGNGKSYQWHKNRELRAMDYIDNKVEEKFESNYIGKATNNSTYRGLFKADLVNFFNGLVQDNVIDTFDKNDLSIEKGTQDDTLIVNYSITPLDSMEKLYSTVTVNR
jgi:hypothetical protein